MKPEKTGKTCSEANIKHFFKEDKIMFEVRITVEAPELAGAMNNLAAAIGGTRVVPSQVPQQPAMSQPQPVVNQQMPTPAPAPMPAPPVGVQAQSTQMPSPGSVAPQNYPAPNVPLAQPPKYTTDQIMTAGAALMDAGKVNELMNLLHSFGVQAVLDLKPEQLGAFATGLRELGAKI